ncbi:MULTISPECIES: oligoendopeptidase F [Bacillus]|uniref:Oligopeptidase F n=1 Tax=Bacillus toyonensis TaxID=155322 RepID=A0AB36SJR4_9BACI|nr:MULTISPECIES: oligoendopeptidase F [Bacillus]EEL19968.1 Oligoendopeptidase F [Bacillus cereus Rock1-3]EEL37454.1 Oligoendopeptidase F [Bacillus cereus Rock3-29]EOP16585.1 oligoendopeptidase F [Bacillus cereus VD131]KAB0444354.1 oligoendopeptidase F [Lysinibacillus sp. VIA-II-2016]KNH38293.1 oligoendopeptidase F [Bacillus thuringiensis]KXY20419.1 oligoendopeptidase F [Bacillus cereus]MDH8707823.1 oligoendopeptidase F [Stenotrophomonas sp. 1198]
MKNVIENRLIRAEVPTELTWDLSDLYKSDAEWHAALNVLENDIQKLGAFKGRLHTSSTTLLNCLLIEEELLMKLTKLSSYANLKESADRTDPVIQANSSKVSALGTKVHTALSFIHNEILSFEEGTIEKYLIEEIKLNPFRKSLLEVLSKRQHTLSPETEEALAALGEVHSSPYKIYGMTKLADMDFNPIQDEQGNEFPLSFALFESNYEFSPSAYIRRKAYESFVSTLKRYKNTVATTYATEVKKQVTLSRLRKYESVTHMLLEPQKVPLEMYNNQLDIIYKELAPHMRRFADLKKKVLGLDQMLFCDLHAPLDPEFNPAITYEEAGKLIQDSLKVLGDEYSSIIEKGFKERWVDLADNVGKSTGAFCSSPYGSHPYILITWQNTMRGCFTLAHEFGHAGHFYLANKNQRIMNVRPSMYFVEAPSTMNELLLAQHLLATTNDKRMRRWVILQLLGTYYHNFVTHLLEGEYQRRVYTLAEEGQALTAKSLTEIKTNVLSTFWGDSVEIDEGAGLTWMRQPHYYMGLYSYTYSAGLTASTAVAQMIKEEGQPAVDRWLDVLRAGGTMKPLELMKHAGVDMSKPDAIRKAVSYVGSLIDELERSYQE